MFLYTHPKTQMDACNKYLSWNYVYSLAEASEQSAELSKSHLKPK
jgi:hypothetical protein